MKEKRKEMFSKTTAHTVIVSSLLIAGAIFSSSPAAAAFIRERCNDDMLTNSAQAHGRNAWAVKCGFADAEEIATYNRKGTYVTTTTGQAPTDPAAPCGGFSPFAVCPIGCFASTEQILFSKRYETLESAARAGRKTVTTLQPGSSTANLIYGESEVEFFTSGDETKDLVCLKDSTGNTLRVTDTHPLVLADGRIIVANQITPGMSLLGVEGAREVKEVRTCPSSDQVWNVQPVSGSTIHNTVIAHGFVTGSLRFQNEWADDLHRLALRRSLEPYATEK